VKPLAIDLCCGLGGWTIGLLATGWDVWGFDIDERFRNGYPGQRFYCGDIRVAGAYLDDLGPMRRAGLVVASPPCEEFSRHQMPWTKRRNPPEPDLSIWQACEHIARELALPVVIENVRKAQDWMGSAKWHCGSYYLWGDVPALMPRVVHRSKESFSSTARAERAMIPYDLALHIGRCFLPSPAPTRDAGGVE
jgi:hypothetical protein